MSYLGPKGYTIYKESIDPEDLKQLREDLTVKAYIPKSPIQPPSFPVYKENANKIYIPRYHGIQNYGEPHEIKIPKGDDINVPFVGSLRPDQQHIVDTFMRSTNAETGGGGLLDIPCGEGKTVDACKIISERRKKTLVIVHKEFLMNQWIERIAQFLPTARVGKIQGQTIDIENKDIVIGMLQSLSMKEYPDDMFHSFGLTIVDECHHISSEVFSRSLQKIITFYTLGLSATMQRKDGLTKVFKMFLGDIVYQKKRANDDMVLVKGIQYITGDDEFNKVVYDYRGNPAFSTMISKLCAYNRRSEFIIKVLQNELAIKPDQQVMILAHNRCLLTYLHDAIQHRAIGTVGYYVGGMKEAALKKSESCKIVIATYSMAAEALDIKSLTTLILATPKTDIVQAVGRILRVKHERPLVIDIIDSHDLFVNQWLKRRKYYISNKYKVIHTDSNLYEAKIDESKKWTTLYEPGENAGEFKKKMKKKDDLEQMKGTCLISSF
jgi:superfamily II DNA or RNA helicase